LIYGIESIFGVQLVGGIEAIIVVALIKPLRKLFPPLVAGTVVFTIGLSLYPTAIRYMAGGSTSVYEFVNRFYNFRSNSILQ